jgi:hypothetical protein
MTKDMLKENSYLSNDEISSLKSMNFFQTDLLVDGIDLIHQFFG